jgi:Fanconi anemia group M protein
MFQDIFSKERKQKENENEEKIKIIADYREKNSMVCPELVSMGFEIEFRNLPIADFLVKDVAIERKTISDFISSMINKRLIRQLEELQQYPKKLLIIEGIEEQELYSDLRTDGINSNAIRGFLLSILLEFNVPIIFTKDSQDTAKFISVLAKKQDKEHVSLRVIKHSFNKKEQMQFILEGFPGIGPATAKKLLKKFKTIKTIANASLEELKEAIGKKAEILKKLFEEEY